MATVLSEGHLFQAVLTFFRRRGVLHAIENLVLVEVTRALPLASPAYDLGARRPRSAPAGRTISPPWPGGDPSREGD